MSHVDVLVVGSADDPHIVRITDCLVNDGVRVECFSQASLGSHAMASRRGALDIEFKSGWGRIDESTTVWWHRSGTARPKTLEADDLALAVDEAPHILKGALAVAGVRWVDDPWTLDRAETKLWQLEVAARLGLHTPEWAVTDVEAVAQQMSGALVAKPLSSGQGVAPFVEAIRPGDLQHLSNWPTLIQQLVPATADFRAVVIHGEGWVWRRPRKGGEVDWRARDPRGQGFVSIDDQGLIDDAVRISSALGLSMSIQDWLEDGSRRVFLESNPQGAWGFLRGSEVVDRALASHLLGRHASAGAWPPVRRRVSFDFLPAHRAPSDDGVISPQFEPPNWLPDVAGRAEALDVARASRERAEGAAAAAEEKASRLSQACLALLALATAVGGYQLGWTIKHPPFGLLSLAPATAAIIFIGLGLLESLQVDRVGVYGGANLESIRSGQDLPPMAAVLAQEEDGRRRARWTAVHKLTDLMQARAWFTRGVVLLVIAGIVAATTRGLDLADDASKRDRPADEPTESTEGP